MSGSALTPSRAWALVGAQFALLIALVLVPRGDLWRFEGVALVLPLSLIAAGLAIAIAAAVVLRRSLTASPIPRPDGELVTSGPFALVRHPIYTGLLLVALGVVLWGGSVLHIVLGVALAVLLAVKARLEERLLLDRYERYRGYAARVGRLIPRVGRLR